MLLPDPTTWQAGDIGFSHNTGLIASGIRFAQRREGNADTDINHAFALYSYDTEAADWVVIQAEIAGVTNYRLLSEVAPSGYYRIHVFPEVDADRASFLDFLDGQISDPYSRLEIASCALDMYLPDKISLRKAGTWICSGLITGGLLYAGYKPFITLPDIYSQTPAKLEQALG